jgi:type IV pilus assembly protein PilM
MTQRIALLDIGSMTTTLYVLEKLQIIYTREQNFGGRQLMDEIQRRYGLSFEEALAAEKYGGLPEDYETEVLGPFKEAVLQQANRALQFFFSSGEHGELHHLVLMGGAAAIVGLDKFLQENLSMKTMIANPFSDMSLSETVNSTMLTHEASSLMLCCGLALRNFDT